MSHYGEPITLKRRRVTRACDRCHKSGVKCAPGPADEVCAPCHAFGSTCTFDRPMKRRGPPSRRQPEDLGELLCDNPRKLPKSEEPWGYKEVASVEIIEKLADVYYWVVYPMYNYFHWPTFKADIRAEKYTHDRSFFVLTMSMCAVALARTRNGVKSPPGTPLCLIMRDLRAAQGVPSSEEFYAAAMKAYPVILCGKVTIDYMRAAGLLTLMCLEYNDRGGAGCHHHKYLQMANEIGLHDETRWPPGLTEIEVQERRRMFWANYRYDIYHASTFGDMVRQRESQSNVLFPAEVLDDSHITANGIVGPPPTASRPSHLQGGNFVCDLYRLLEHVNDRLRARHGEEKDRSPLVSRLFERQAGPSTAEVLQTIQELYDNLPVDLKVVKEMSGDVTQDHYGYVAVDIIITMMTIKMVLAGSEEQSIPQRCAIAGELLDMLAGVPASFLSASSAPTLHHLAGVGHLLGSVIQTPLSHWKYLQVRSVLLAMVDVVASLESGHSVDKGIARMLREHVNRIDSYMSDAANRTKAAGTIAALSGRGRRRGPAVKPETDGFAADGHSMQGQGHVADDQQRAGAGHWSSTDTATHPHQDMTSVEALLAAAQSAQPLPYPTTYTQPQNLVSPQSLNITPGMGLLPDTTWSTPEGAEANFQFQLPEDLFAEWPFNFGQGNAFDFLTIPTYNDGRGTQPGLYPSGEAGLAHPVIDDQDLIPDGGL